MLSIERMMRVLMHINVGACIALLAWMAVNHSSQSHSSVLENLTAHLIKEQK
jgi:hypothetical protein